MPFIDPFLMQLFVVPLFVIGIGVLVAALMRKWWIGPLVTLLLNLAYETWYNVYYYEFSLQYTSWNVIFPVISLGFSLMIVAMLKMAKHDDRPSEDHE